MNIRPNRVKQKLAAGQVATILAGTNDPDLSGGGAALAHRFSGSIGRRATVP